MLSILLGEGYEITDRDLTLLRQNLCLRMRDQTSSRRTRTVQGGRPQPTPEDLMRFQKRCEESDERLIMGTRRVRTKTWNGIPADDPDLQPRFPSEKTISACKRELGLSMDRKKYIFMRDTFQRICTEAGITKKSHNPEAWENVKLALLKAVPFLNRTYSRPSRPIKGDSMWFALDIICSDVAKKIRVLGTKLDIKQVKQTLKMDPHQVTRFRRDFVELLRNTNFTSKLNVSTNVWDRLKRSLHSESPHLQAALPVEIWDQKDDKRVKAFEYLCRDVTKRYKDRRVKTQKPVEDKEFTWAELGTPANEFQAPPLAEPNNTTPIAQELLAPRSYHGESINRRPVLRYTAEGLATVIFEPESSGGGKTHKKGSDKKHKKGTDKKHKRRIIPGRTQNQLGTRSVIPTLENDDLNVPVVNEHEDFMRRFGPPATSIVDNDVLNMPVLDDHEDFMRRFAPPSANTITENDHFERQILEDHEEFARQFGFGTPPDVSIMENDHPNMSAIEDQDDCLRRNEFGTHSVVPIVETDHLNISVTEENDDNFRENVFATQSALPTVEIAHFDLPVTEDHDNYFRRNEFVTQSVFPTLETDHPTIPIIEDHGDFFPRFGTQSVLPTMENNDSNIQIMQSIEVDNPHQPNYQGLYVDDDPFYLGPTGFTSDSDIDEEPINDDDVAESFQEYEYPDPTNYGI